jgi:hypothetical protein
MSLTTRWSVRTSGRLPFRPILVALALAAVACRDAATDAVAPRTPRVSPMVYGELASPVLIGAVRDSSRSGFDWFTVTFDDIATDETLTSVLFSGGTGFTQTQSIAGTTDTGLRTATVYAAKGYTTVQLCYYFGSSCGPWSASMPIVDATKSGSTTVKGKGKAH